MTKIICLTLTIVLSLIGAAEAQPAKGEASPPAPSASGTPVDPATLAAAREMVAASDVQNMVKKLIPEVIDATMSNATNMFKQGTIPQELQQQLAQVTREGMTSMMADTFTPEVLDQMAVIYARYFSISELNHLTAMMRDPVMVSWRERSPLVMRDLAPVMVAAMQPKQEAFKKRVFAVITEWVKTHPEDKKLLARPITS